MKFCFVSRQKCILIWCKLLWSEINSTDLLLDPVGVHDGVRTLHPYLNSVFNKALERGNVDVYWIEFFTRLLSWLLLLSFGIHLGGQSLKAIQFLEEKSLQRKFWCPDSIFWIIFHFFLLFSEIANNRCLNSSQAKNSNWFQKKLEGSRASVWHLWKYKHVQMLHFQPHSKTILKKF